MVRSIRKIIERAVNAFRLRDRETHRDLVQDAVTRLFIGLSSGRFRGESSLGTYAQNVAKYTCLEHLRRRRFETRAWEEINPIRSKGMGPEESILNAEENARNLGALSALPDECRELLRLVFVEELPYRDVAAKLGLSEGAIKSRVHRCRLLLRSMSDAAARSENDRRARLVPSDRGTLGRTRA